MLRNMLGLMVIVLALSTPACADALKVMAAGSLRAAVTDLLHRFPLQSDTVDPPEFGPSEPIQKVVESNESFVIPCVVPESQTWGAACGSLNTVVLPITVAFAIRVTRRTPN